MKLSKRLETIAQMVPSKEDGRAVRVADIGTDHGFVPIWLLLHDRAETAIAMDVRKGPLLRAHEHIQQYGLSDRIEVRLSDGLEKLNPGEVQTVVIAGMGGELMLRIIKDGGHVRDTIQHWVLSPQSELEEFRRGLEELGLSIRKEIMLEEDGKYYTVMLAEPGAMHYESAYEYRYGKYLLDQKSPVLAEFLVREKHLLEQILKQLKEQAGEGAKKRLVQVEKERLEVEKALREMDM